MAQCKADDSTVGKNSWVGKKGQERTQNAVLGCARGFEYVQTDGDNVWDRDGVGRFGEVQVVCDGDAMAGEDRGNIRKIGNLLFDAFFGGFGSF